MTARAGQARTPGARKPATRKAGTGRPARPKLQAPPSPGRGLAGTRGGLTEDERRERRRKAAA